MLTEIQLIGFGVGGGGPPTVTFEASYGDEADTTTYTFSACDLGAGGKIVVNAIGIRAAPVGTISSITVGGASASLVIGQSDSTDQRRIEMWQIDGVSGGTGDIVVTWGSTQQGCRIDVFSVQNTQSAAYDTANSNAAPPTDTMNIPANGVAIGGCISNGGTVSWTGLTENTDNTTATAGLSSASDFFSSAETGRTISPSPFTAAGAGLVGASWAPG